MIVEIPLFMLTPYWAAVIEHMAGVVIYVPKDFPNVRLLA